MLRLFRRRPDPLADADEFAPRPWFGGIGSSLRHAVGAPGRWSRAALRRPTRLWGDPETEGGRSWRRLAGALPAAGAAILLVAFGFVGHHRRAGLAGTYEAAARAASVEGDAEAAVLFRRRLGELGRNREADRLNLAAALSAAGRDQEAFDLLAGLLGGVDDPGYAPAHLLLADRLLAEPDVEAPDSSSDVAGDSPPKEAEGTAANRMARRGRALQHLSAALRAAPNEDGVKARAAALLIRAGEPAAAAPLLEVLAEDRPEVWPELLRLYVGLGRSGDAARAAEGATPVLRGELNRNPLDFESRARLTDALIRRGRFDEAVSTLAASRSLHPEKNVDRLLAAMYVGEYDRAVAARDRRLGRRLKLLERALEFDARFGPALVRLANFDSTAATQFAANAAAPTVEEARDLLKRLLATGEAPAGVHFALGLNALRAEDAETATFHFERAHQLDPNLAQAANNLAFLLSQQDEPDLKRALALADAAVAAAPNYPQVRHTRGAILAALDRPDDALLEYEKAMELGLNRDAKVRAEVAELYERLGRADLAGQFRDGSNPAPSN
ncbi:tetratricopeptide repeat protein [Alienimonas chondri]|uniref:Tetratricopeptide repeat protein n=1 Tax=Alienimonas chondri TaxID=2681879 RepID=A0ABX1VDV9_9PLAN|nr:hypothetical protein [Alienimonas chondri]NNJ26274.1 hypothetical protein [Alienimonas chondri]